MTDRDQTFIEPVCVRSLGPADRESWLPLWKGYQAFYGMSISDEVSRATWSRLLDPGEPMYGALAYGREGRATGLTHWLTHRSTTTTGDYCYLQDLFVAPEARRGGLGRRLIEHVYREAEALGCSRVYWLTHETNQTAMALYDRLADRTGFVQYRRTLA